MPRDAQGRSYVIGPDGQYVFETAEQEAARNRALMPSNTPSSSVPSPSWTAPTARPSQSQAPATANAQRPGTLGDVGSFLNTPTARWGDANVGFDNWMPWFPGANPSWWAPAGQPEEPTREAAPEAVAPMDFGAPRVSDSDQRLSDQLAEIQASVGSNALPDAPVLPNAPVLTADPGLQTLADSATSRNAQVQELFGELQGEIKDRDPGARNRWLRLGEYLGQLAASGDLSQAGAIMSDMMQRDESMRHELRMESLALTLQGFGFEDAVTQAQANLLSGQHQATQQTAQNQFQRDTAQVGIESDYALAGFEAQTDAAQAQAQIAMQRAGIEAEAEQRGEDRWERGIQAFAGIPEYAEGANTALAGRMFDDPRTAGALGEGLARQSRLARVATMAASGLDRGDRRQLARDIRRIDPTLTDQDIEEVILLMQQRAPE